MYSLFIKKVETFCCVVSMLSKRKTEEDKTHMKFFKVYDKTCDRRQCRFSFSLPLAEKRERERERVEEMFLAVFDNGFTTREIEM